MIRYRSVSALVVTACAVLCSPGARAQDLVGIGFSTGRIYRIPTDGSAPTVLNNTGPGQVGSFERLADGSYYGFSVQDGPATLYRFDPTTFAATSLGLIAISGNPPTNQRLYEGGIVQAPDGTVYITNGDNAFNDQLLRLDLSTRTATVIGQISGTESDINGLAWRSDGVLVGVDRGSSSLVTINPASGIGSTLRALPFAVGPLGGMTAIGRTGYLVNSVTGPVAAGLYSFDLFTGETTLLRNLSSDLGTDAIGGLAVLTPEPASGLLLPLAAAFLRRRTGKARG